MILDSSAVLAIVLGESDLELFARAISDATIRRISAASFVESSIVADRRGGAEGLRQFDLFVQDSRVVIESVTQEQALLARRCFSDYGKGHHPAGLNFGDCFAYALAKSTGEPLLFKGDDFRHTDIVPAV